MESTPFPLTIRASRAAQEGKRYGPSSVSPDGSTLFLARIGETTQRDILMVPLQGSGETLSAGKVTVLLETAAHEIKPMVSPNGKWLAYSVVNSNDGTDGLYVRPVSGLPAKWQLASGPTMKPILSQTGSRLFFKRLRLPGLQSVEVAEQGNALLASASKDFGSTPPPFATSPGNG